MRLTPRQGTSPARLARASPRWVIAAIVVGAVTVTVTTVVVAGALIEDGDVEKSAGLGKTEAGTIREIVEAFAAAVEGNDLPSILHLLCEEEATAITEDDDYDSSHAGDPEAVEPAHLQVEIAAVEISGDVASAQVKRASQPVTMLYFRKEEGDWKICASAGDQAPFGSSPPS